MHNQIATATYRHPNALDSATTHASSQDIVILIPGGGLALLFPGMSVVSSPFALALQDRNAARL